MAVTGLAVYFIVAGAGTSGLVVGPAGVVIALAALLAPYLLPPYQPPVATPGPAKLIVATGGSVVAERIDHLHFHQAPRAREVERATPPQFLQDLTLLLRALDNEARTARLPPYLPPQSDLAALSRNARARRGIRSGRSVRPGDCDETGDEAARAYQVPAERPDDADTPQRWSDVTSSHQLVVVLADPGLGKSWLIRGEASFSTRNERNGLGHILRDRLG